LSPVVELLPPLREEWAGLEFDPGGRLLNGLTREPVASFALLDGRHRQAGARYRTTITTPKYDLPEERRAEFEKESRKLSQRNAKQEAWSDHFARRRAASIQVGTEEQLLTLTLRDDSSRRLAFAVSDETEHWTVEVDLEHGRLPKVHISGTLDLTARLKADGTPGCLSGIFGGTGAGTASLDLATVERDGSLLVAEGQANRFKGNAGIDVRTSPTTWAVDGKGVLRARGLARPIMWFAGRRVRRSIDESLAEFWTDSESHMRDLDREIQRLRAAVTEEGGAAPFVRRALWDEDFDLGLDSVRRRPR
jgi:hypothetical protein